jgi:hypothetical protein
VALLLCTFHDVQFIPKMSPEALFPELCKALHDLDLQRIEPITALRTVMTSVLPSSIFRYSSLQSPSDEIRLLTLLPGKRSEMIHCSVVNTALSQHSNYEALSYAWGTGRTGIRIIALNGLAFPVAPSLWDALYHLRHEEIGRVLWIDALCINQIDEKEKGKQIEIMKRIYQQATRVVIWLGKSTPESDLAMDILSNPKNLDLGRFLVTPIDPITQTNQNALNSLFRRRWWFRAWVLQEVAVASGQTWVGCGDKWLAWDKLQVYYDRVMAQKAKNLFLWPTCAALLTVKRGTGIRMQRDSIGVLLVNTYHFEATDARDKVYSLMGLATAADELSIQPSYRMTVRQLYIVIARRILLDNDINVNILCFNINSSHHDLPSWVPDWSRSTQGRRIWAPGIGYRASTKARSKITFKIASGLLIIDGYIVDDVAYFDSKSHAKNDVRSSESDIVDNIEILLAESRSLQQSSRSPSLSYNTPDAVWRTLVANRMRSRPKGVPFCTPVMPYYGQQFEVFRGRSQIPDTFMPERSPPVRKQAYIEPFLTSMRVQESQFLITGNGYLGLGPPGLQTGDLVVILDGAHMPFVIRNRTPYYQLIGWAYIHGLMEGEAFEGGSNRKRKRFTFQ